MRLFLILSGLLVLGAAVAAQGRLALAPDGLTAFRPGHGTGTFPFARTAVPDALEEDPRLGPGIRVNGAGEVDPVTEDDLIEVRVRRVVQGAALFLERDDAALELWSTRTRQPGTQLVFSGDRTGPLAFPGAGSLTLWAECTTAGAGHMALTLVPEAGGRLDRLVFHRFAGIVLALGGQVPGLPLDPNEGTFVVATALYEQGYDVFAFDEDGVAADGSGPIFDEAVNAVQHRAVSQIAIFGYSHGGGSTYSLAGRLDLMALAIGPFTVPFTSYVDGVRNNSDIDTAMELRHPIGSLYHANQYQVGSLQDFFLDGGPVPSSDPPPTGLNVETTPWGANATHFLVDDYVQVRSFIESNLELRMNR